MEIKTEQQEKAFLREMGTKNVLVFEGIQLRLSDFGDSRYSAEDRDSMKTTCANYLYSAPELYQGGKYTAKSDIFSFSIILWESCCRAKSGQYVTPYEEYDISFDFQVLIQVYIFK